MASPQLFPPYIGEPYPADMAPVGRSTFGSWVPDGPQTHRLIGGQMVRAGAQAEEGYNETMGVCHEFVPGGLGIAGPLLEHSRKMRSINRMFAYASDFKHTRKWPLFEKKPHMRKDYTGPPVVDLGK
jgi:hypothetical protein